MPCAPVFNSQAQSEYLNQKGIKNINKSQCIGISVVRYMLYSPVTAVKPETDFNAN